jgi:hypothetical protein
MGAFSMKVLAPLAAALAITLMPLPAMAGGEMPMRPAPPPPQMVAPPVAPAPCAQPCSLCEVLLYYVPNRALDFIDIFRANIGLGCGFGVNVRATELAEIGMGQYQTTRFGMKGRILPVYEENIDECGFAILGYVNGCLQRDPTEVGADLHLGIIGAQAAVSLAEAADFIAGFLLIDLQGDDLGCSPWD